MYILDFEYEIQHPMSTRHLERNMELGPPEETTELYGPDKISYEKCKQMFESRSEKNKIWNWIEFLNLSKNGIVGIVLHSGDAGDTMEEHIYYEEKFKLMKNDVNVYRFSNHVGRGLELFDTQSLE